MYMHIYNIYVSTVNVACYLICKPLPHNVDILIVLILQKRSLKLREVGFLAPGHMAHE